jgi:hypothetical protein
MATLDESNPRFLRESASQPTALETLGAGIAGLAEGAYSWPFDFTLCLHWMAGTAGYYGSRVQTTCNHHTRRILEMFGQSARLAYYLIFRGVLFKVAGSDVGRLVIREGLARTSVEGAIDAVVNNLPALSRAAARTAGRSVTGTAFTAWMASRGRVAAAPRGRAVGAASFNFIALLWGSALHASLENPRSFDIVTVFVSWLTGDPNYRLSDEQYMAIYQAVQAVEEATIGDDREDLEAFRAVLDILLRFGRTGGDP